MDIALVTGADAGPGLAIARRLIGMGCRVYALASQFTRNPFPHDDFITLACDLADPAAVTKAAEDVLAREGHVTFVVHAARRAPVPLLDTPVAVLAERINTGLLAPLALVRATLPWLRKEQGHFLVLCWSGEGAAPGGPVTAAIEGGLRHFADQLFDELRDDGVRATTIYARPNPETTPEAALALDPQSAVNPELVADAVEHLLRLRPSNVVSTLVIRPAATAETPRIARSAELAGLATRDYQLPPRQNFPEEPEPIQTPPRARPADAPPPGMEEFVDEDDEEDDDWDPDVEPLPWAQGREGGPADGPRDEPRQGDREPSARPPGEPGYDYQGGQQGGGRGGRGRGRRRGRGRGRGRGGDRPGYVPGGQPQPGQPAHSNQPPPSRPPNDYPDAEEESADRAFARDDSFRTPHDENEPPSDDSSPDAEPGRRDDAPPEDFSSRDREPAPVAAAAPGHRRPVPDAQQERPRPQHPPQHQSSNRPPAQDHSFRRHRRPGRRPPPGAGRGPGPEAE